METTTIHSTKRNDAGLKQTNLQVTKAPRFFKITRTKSELTHAREMFIKKLSLKQNNISLTEIQGTCDYDEVQLKPGETLLEAVKINTKKGCDTVITQKITQTGVSVNFEIDSVNGDTRPSVIAKYRKNKDFVRFWVESTLKFIQTKPEGIMTLYTSNDDWKERFACMQARRKIFPHEPRPLLFLEGKYRHSDIEGKLEKELEKLTDRYIEDYTQQKITQDHDRPDLNAKVHHMNMQAKRMAPGCCTIL